MKQEKTVSITYADVVNVESRQIRVSDVVELTTLDSGIEDKVVQKVIATIPADKSNVTLTRHDIASLIRRRIPGLPLSENHKGDELVRIEYSKIDEFIGRQTCYGFSKSVIKGQAIIAEDLTAVTCDGNQPLAAMKYNASTNVLRASDNISAGSYAGRISVPTGKYADTNDELVLRVVVGPVKIEKTVWALQPANGADRIFVKDRQGNVLRVPIQSPVSKEAKK